jgi:outer membrane lipoprotein-sorting protein
MRTICSATCLGLMILVRGVIFGQESPAAPKAAGPATAASTAAETTADAPKANGAPSGTAGADPTSLVKNIAEKYAAAKTYGFDGDVAVTRKIAGDERAAVLAKAKVKFVTGSGGKYRLEINKAGKDASVVFVSDGQTRWAYAPMLKQYSVNPVPAGPSNEDAAESFDDPNGSSESEIVDRFCQLAIPILMRLGKTAETVFRDGNVLTVFSKNDDRGGQHMMYLTALPAALTARQMVWIKAVMVNGEKVLIRSEIKFNSFRAEEPIDDAEFTFIPPADATRTDNLVIPVENGPSASRTP